MEQNRHYGHAPYHILTHLALSLLFLLLSAAAMAQQPLTQRYNAEHPLVITGDWDKPPYEYQNDHGEPAGSNIDVMRAIMEQLDIPCRFVLKEWGGAIKMFERGEADLILANARRYQKEPYHYTHNIINYNRIRAVVLGSDSSTAVVSRRQMVEEGVVLKPSDYSVSYFLSEDSAYASHIEFQSPKVALLGLLAKDFKYFVWGEEPLKWKMKELNMNQEGFMLREVDIPISEIRVIGRDKALIDEIDDHYSRMKQSGEVAEINNRWMHPELANKISSIPTAVYIILGILLLAVVCYLMSRIARSHVRNAMRDSTELNDMMYKALHMGRFHVMQYDIANDRWTNRYGSILPAKGMTQKEFISRIHPSEQQELERKIRRMMQGRERKTILNKRWNTGSKEQPQWLNFRGHAMAELDEKGHPAYIINTINDVTSNVEKEQATYELAKKYDRLINMPFLSISFYDKDGMLITLNDAMKELCDFKTSETERFFRQVCMFDIPLFREVYTPDDREEALVCQHMYYPDRDLDRYIEFNVRPLFDENGEIANYFISTIDVTEERRLDHEMHLNNKDIRNAEKQINRYETQLQYLLKVCNMYVWWQDLAKNTLQYSRSLRHIEYTETFDEYISRLSDAIKGEATEMTEALKDAEGAFHLVRRFNSTAFNDQPSWHDIHGIPTRNSLGETVGFFGVMRDITKLVEAQEQLRREAQRAEDSGQQKSMFLASMTHELRTPLNSIVGFSDLLRTIDTPEERAEFIRIIRTNCDILLRLINDILEASSITDSQMAIIPTDIDFAKEFSSICQTLEQRVQGTEVRFVKDSPHTKLLTRLDIGRIQQVVTNFVTNAVKYTHQGFIRVGYRIDSRFGNTGVYVYCQDTGDGIPKDKQDSVFERFVKLNDFVQGTGLGLAICKSIIERCGGKIGVRSEVGKGSTFWFWVPVEIKEVEPQPSVSIL